MYIRSSSASDTTPTLTVYDTTSNEQLQLNGRREAVTSATLTDLRWAVMDTSATGTVSVYSEDTGLAAVGDIRINSIPADGVTVTIGLTGISGFNTTYTWKTTPISNGQIKRGATVDECADNLASAINDASTGNSTPVDGTDWILTGTAPAAANTWVSATVSNNVVECTDRILCLRSLAWAFSQSSTELSIRQPIGGRDGTLLVDFSPSETEAYNGSISLDSEDLATTTLPPAKTGATDAIAIGGKTCTIDISCGDMVTGPPAGSVIVLKLQTSNDLVNWFDSSTSISNIGDVTTTPDRYTPTEHIAYMRLNITTNTNTVAAAVNAKVIY
jgi:hypothetical protein